MQANLTEHRLKVFSSQMQTYTMDWGKYKDDNVESAPFPNLSSVSLYKEFELPETEHHPLQVYPWFLLRPIDPLEYKQAEKKFLDDEAEEGNEVEEADEDDGERPRDALPSQEPQ